MWVWVWVWGVWVCVEAPGVRCNVGQRFGVRERRRGGVCVGAGGGGSKGC